MSERIDFHPKVAEQIRKRVNFQCSVPRCKNAAVGPATDSTDASVNLGTACHIFSAAPNGPRGQGGKTEEWIGSVENGIWCCKSHGDRIDKRKGKEFPPETLLAWKALAEARVRVQMNGETSPLGWIDTIELEAGEIYRDPIKLELQKTNILLGDEGSGKSLLFEMAACASDSAHGRRLQSVAAKTALPLKTTGSIKYSTADKLDVELRFEFSKDSTIRTQDGKVLLAPPSDISVVYFEADRRLKEAHEDDFEYFRRVLQIDPSSLSSMSEVVGQNDGFAAGRHAFIEAANDDEDDSQGSHARGRGRKLELVSVFAGASGSVVFEDLSRSQKTRLFIQFFIQKARNTSRQCPTLLLLDLSGTNLDEHNFSKLLNILESEAFQTIVIPPNVRIADVESSEAPLPEKPAPIELSSWAVQRICSIKRARMRI